PAPRAGGLASGLRLEPPARPRLPALPVAGTRGRGGTRTAATVHPRSAAHPGRAPHAAAPGGPAGPCLPGSAPSAGAGAIAADALPRQLLPPRPAGVRRAVAGHAGQAELADA